MRNTPIKSYVQPALMAIALTMSLAANANDQHALTTSFLDRLLSPPAPLRTAEAETVADTGSQFSIAGSDAASGTQWTLRLPPTEPLTLLSSANGLQQIGTALLNQAGAEHAGTQQSLVQSASGVISSLSSLQSTQSQSLRFPATDTAVVQADNNRVLGQWLANAARYAGNVQVNAVMPMDGSFVTQAPTDAITGAINSKETTQYLEQHSDAVTLLAQFLGWQKTGLLPSVADLQRMASDHVGAVSSRIEHWALKNVSFSSSTLAVTHAETEQPMLQWQWSITSNNSQYSGDSFAENEANFGANLRRLFGMNDYY